MDLQIYPPRQEGVCPNCSADLSVVSTGNSSSRDKFSGQFLSDFTKTLRDVIFRPKDWFQKNSEDLLRPGGISKALAFAVIVQWIASFFNFIWRSMVGATVENHIHDLFQISEVMIDLGPETSESMSAVKQQIISFLFGAGTVILAPFQTIASLAVSSLFVHMAVRFFMADVQGRPQQYSTTLKILSYALGPWILCAIPGAGFILGYILAFTASFIGLREVYRTTTSRAILAVIFPELLVMAFFLAMLFFMLFVLFHLARMVF